MTAEDWAKHFESVSNLMGKYEGEYWEVIKCNDHWKIIGKATKYNYHSLINNESTIYTSPFIILRELYLLEPHIKNIFEDYNGIFQLCK